jgi:hypothetical protein
MEKRLLRPDWSAVYAKMALRSKRSQVRGEVQAMKDLQAGARYGVRIMGKVGTEYYTNHVWNNHKVAGFRVSVSFDPYSPYQSFGFDVSPNEKAIVRGVLSIKSVHKLRTDNA